ncbi:glycosyl hydrolase [Nonomuraea sp. NPDC050790]|uniref:glycoside hydrolase family 26 protein n=1 Tax=Nonomuraea sp. NPDC050790 TaxID=3364371 RepID=UPI0037AF630F
MRTQMFPGLRHRGALGAAVLLVAAVAVQPDAVAEPERPGAVPIKQRAALGVFMGSDAHGTARLPDFERWLGREVTVGRTYIPGETWAAFHGPDFILEPWTRWRSARPGRILAINVPMVAPNEGGLTDAAVSVLLNAGAAGAFDLTFKKLADRLVDEGAGDSIIVLGWEMNGTTYSSRCAPDPVAWKAYWRRIVTSMRSAPGQRFRFDFTANRGRDAIPWTECYPGDDVVDIIGMDNYDQPPSDGFQSYVSQPYGLRDHAEFAKAHGKPMSFPEWGLFRYGDRPTYVRQMLDWIGRHNVAYHSLSDYCPHGVWQCSANPRSAAGFRSVLQQMLPTPDVPTPTTPPLPSAPAVPPKPAVPSTSALPSTPALPSTSALPSKPALPSPSGLPSASALPAKPALPSASALPAKPALPSPSGLPSAPALPSMSALPAKPAVPSTLPSASALPAKPALPSASALPAKPALPSASALPAKPALPSASALPSAPALPSASALPSAPALPGASTLPSAPAIPLGAGDGAATTGPVPPLGPTSSPVPPTIVPPTPPTITPPTPPTLPAITLPPQVAREPMLTWLVGLWRSLLTMVVVPPPVELEVPGSLPSPTVLPPAVPGDELPT